MHIRQKTIKGIFQRGNTAYNNSDVIVRIKIEKDKSATISFSVDDVSITVNRASIFKFLGGRIYD